MRKRNWIGYLSVILFIAFLANCAKQPVIPGVPINLRATGLVGEAGVELRWDAVAGAASYDVTITKRAASGSRETFGPYSTTQTYFLALRETVGAGEFDWTVSAKNNAGPSSPGVGSPFTLAPEPEPEPEYGLVLTLEEKPTPFSEPRSVPAIHVFGGYKNDDSGSRKPTSDFVSFNYILATLAYRLLPLTTEKRENMPVQFMVERIGSGEAKRWPDSDTEFLLDEEGQLVVGINDLGENFGRKKAFGREVEGDLLEPGHYYFWARAAWDSQIQSAKTCFDIVLLENPLIASIVLEDEEGMAYATKVCPTSTEVTLVYAVCVEGGEWFGELCYHFNIAQQGEDGTLETTESGTFTNATAFSTTVTYATECTKYATLTLDGTVVVHLYDNEEATEITVTLNARNYVIASRSFVLDMADPTALVSLTLPAGFSPTEPASLTCATLTFLASDTKCLQPYGEKISFEVYVEKGVSSWSETFAFFVEEVVLGDNSIWNNEITIDATYLATKTSSTNPDEAQALLRFDIPIMDYATITATMSVHDCCCDDCTVEPGECDDPDELLSHATEVSTQFIVDNVFFSSLLDIDEILETEGLLGEEGDIPVLPASPAYATFTIRLADANWDVHNPFIVSNSVTTEDGSLFPNPTFNQSMATGTELQECSGYATKSTLTLIGNANASPNPNLLSTEATEIVLTFTATTADNANNVFSFSFQALFDTLPPTLTHFAAFRDQINNQSWIEFAFDQKPENAALALTVTASGTFSYDLEDAMPITGLDNAYRLETGVTLPYDTAITLNATSTDLAGNIGFSSKTSTVSLSEKR